LHLRTIRPLCRTAVIALSAVKLRHLSSLRFPNPRYFPSPSLTVPTAWLTLDLRPVKTRKLSPLNVWPLSLSVPTSRLTLDLRTLELRLRTLTLCLLHLAPIELRHLRALKLRPLHLWPHLRCRPLSVLAHLRCRTAYLRLLSLRLLRPCLLLSSVTAIAAAAALALG